jgi:hypothetical protein
MLRTCSLLLCAVVLLALAACGGGSTKTGLTDSGAIDQTLFELTPAEQAALSGGDESALLAEFGDPSLGSIGMSTPPAGMGDGVFASQSTDRGVSTAKWKKNKCKKHKKASCNRCKCDRCGRTECPNQDEDDCDTPSCEIVDICNLSERLVPACDCCDAFADVIYCAKVIFSDDNCNKKGVEVVFKRDGQEVGRGTTNKQGVAYFTETHVAKGDYTSSACVDLNQEWGQGNNGNNNDTNNQGDEEEWLCSDLPFVVYTTCNHGAVTGKGEIPACDPGNTMGRAKFMFRTTYKDGEFQGRLTYMDGNVNINDEPITWMVIHGLGAYFGNGEWYVHVHDGGKGTFVNDTFEIHIWDTQYHNKGNLLNCFIHTSYKHTIKCPPAPAAP